MKNKFSKLSLSLLALGLFFLNGCKDPVIKGKDSNPIDLLNLQVLDTFTVYTTTQQDTTFDASGLYKSCVGSMYDPFLGTTYGSVYGQCKLSAEVFNLANNPVIDSVVLSFPYYGKYGHFDKPVTLNVYELNQSIDPNQTYQTNDAFGVNLPPIGTVSNFVPDLVDSVLVNGQLFAPQLRIRLSSAFAAKLLHGDSATFATNDNFTNFFKGFYLSTSSIGNGMIYLDMQNTKMVTYYHNDLEPILRATFPIANDANSTRITLNHFDHNYTNTPAKMALNSHAISDSVFYAQAGSGLRTFISIPGLNNLPKNSLAVMKAELIMTQKAESAIDSNNTLYYPAEEVAIKWIDSGGTVLSFGSSIDNGGFGNVTNFVSNGVTYNRYSFPMTLMMQQFINANTIAQIKGFYLVKPFSFYRASRFIGLNSPTNDDFKVKLKIVYSKLK